VTKQTTIDYAKHDVSKTQELIFELLRTMPNPSGEELVNLLLSERYSWFSVVPVNTQPYVPCMEISLSGYYADGITIYTDVAGEKHLVPILKKKLPHAQVDFMTMRPINEVEFDADFPKETTAFIVISWDVPTALEEKFTASVK